MLLIRSIISALCAIGFYASVFMLRKAMLARRGLLAQPSVVETSRAALLGGVPNALFGCLYYPALAATAWSTVARVPLALALAAATAAAAMSVYLAYSLLFVTKRSCPYCWSAHAVNWLLFGLWVWLFVLR